MAELDQERIPGKPDVIELWGNRLEAELKPSRVVQTAMQIFEGARWNSTERLHKLGRELCREMRANGFDEAEVLEVPSDGKTHHGGWAMPLEWSPRSASLVVEAEAGEVLLQADYDTRPHHLVLFSRSTPEGGVSGELVKLPDEPSDEELKIVGGCFAFLAKAPSIEESQRLMRAGALGWITDFVSRIPGVKDGPELEDAVSYLNFNIAPWAIPEAERAVGFAITPRQGRRLREALARGGTVHATASADVQMGPGSTPVITGRIQGKSGKEVFLTAHIDEPGAVDNASGPAMVLELCRAITAMKARDGAPLTHGIRVFFGVEVRGIQGLLNTRPELFQNGLFGMNIDMIGTDPAEARCALLAVPAVPGCPDFVFPLLARMLDKLATEEKTFRWKEVLMVDDNAMCDPAFKIPIPVLVQGPDATYHTDLDVPGRLDREWIQKLGCVVGKVLAGLADADADVVEYLLRLNFQYAMASLERHVSRPHEKADTQASGPFQYLIDRERRRIRSTLAIANCPEAKVPLVGDIDPADPELDMKNNAAVMLRSLASRLEEELVRFGEERIKQNSTGLSGGVLKVDRLIPRKTFAGPFAVDNLPDRQARRIEAAAGKMTWCGPNWLQAALGLANGTRSVRQIHHALIAENLEIALPVLLETFKALEACGFVQSIPYLDETDLEGAFREVGVRKGMLLMLHSGLSRFGYIAGGADTLLDTLIAVLGEEGTLCTPTHSLCWAGQESYDPDTSPSVVGAVTNAFRKRPGVQRSAHPTHSVAVHGPRAESLIAGHDKTCAPMGREGFWGHFVEQDGWVLLMSPRLTNTVMHTVEIWGGVPAPGVYLPRGEDGKREILPMIPWHVDWFEDIYAVLDRRGSIRKARLGRSEIELMRAREIVEIGLELIREDPKRVCPEGCTCEWCRLLAGHRP